MAALTQVSVFDDDPLLHLKVSCMICEEVDAVPSVVAVVPVVPVQVHAEEDANMPST